MTEKQHTRLWFSPHGTEWEAETYEEALEMERDALVEQLFEAQRQGRVWRAIANRDEPKVSADRTRLEEQLETLRGSLREIAEADLGPGLTGWQHVAQLQRHAQAALASIPAKRPYEEERKEREDFHRRLA